MTRATTALSTTSTLPYILMIAMMIWSFDASPASAGQSSTASVPASTGSPVALNTTYVVDAARDFASIATSPLRWDGQDWMTAGGVAGTAWLLYENDAKIQRWVQRSKTTTTGNAGDDITYIGLGALTIPVVGGMYLYGEYTGDARMSGTALLSVESLAITGIFVQALKIGSGRHRPYTEDGPYAWDGPGKHTGNEQSFPSGHASLSFALATVIASEYNNAVTPPIAYGVAAVTALNRVQHNAHWASDIFVGSALGYFTGKAVVALHADRSLAHRASLAPLIDNDARGLVLSWRY